MSESMGTLTWGLCKDSEGLAAHRLYGEGMFSRGAHWRKLLPWALHHGQLLVQIERHLRKPSISLYTAQGQIIVIMQISADILIKDEEQIVHVFKDINKTYRRLPLSSRKEIKKHEWKDFIQKCQFQMRFKIRSYFPILSLPTSPSPDAFAHCWERYLGT